jgi:hypothetical protein
MRTTHSHPAAKKAGVKPGVSIGSAKIAERKQAADEKAKKEEAERNEMKREITALREQLAQAKLLEQKYERKELEHSTIVLTLQKAEFDKKEKDYEIHKLKEAAEKHNEEFRKVTADLLAANNRKDVAEGRISQLTQDVAALKESLDIYQRLNSLKTEAGKIEVKHPFQTPAPALNPSVAPTPVSRPVGLYMPATSARPRTSSDALVISAFLGRSSAFFTPNCLSILCQIEEQILVAEKDSKQVALLEDFRCEFFKNVTHAEKFSTTTSDLLAELKSQSKFAELSFKPLSSSVENRLTKYKTACRSDSEANIYVCSSGLLKVVRDAYGIKNDAVRQGEFSTLATAAKLKSVTATVGATPALTASA